MAITSPGTVTQFASSTPATTFDITHTTATGTELLILCFGYEVDPTLSSVEVWDTGQSFTEIWKSGLLSRSDVGFYMYGLVSPTIQTNTITITFSANSDHIWIWMANYAGNDTASVAAATNILETIDVTDASTGTLSFASAGSAGNGLLVGTAQIGEDGDPASTPTGFTEIAEGVTGGGLGGAADNAFAAHHLLDGAPSAAEVIYSSLDEVAGAYIEIVAAAASGANPKGPLGMPFHGPFGGPI